MLLPVTVSAPPPALTVTVVRLVKTAAVTPARLMVFAKAPVALTVMDVTAVQSVQERSRQR